MTEDNTEESLRYGISYKAYAIEAKLAGNIHIAEDPDTKLGSLLWGLLHAMAAPIPGNVQYLLKLKPRSVDHALLDQDVAGLLSAVERHNIAVTLRLLRRIQVRCRPKTLTPRM